jgi:hypothetical protein
MKWFWSVLAGVAAFMLLRGQSPAATTNTISVADQGKLEIVAPGGWRFGIRDSSRTGVPLTFEVRSEDGQALLLMNVFWDGFGPKQFKPTDADLLKILTLTSETQYVPTSVEKKLTTERISGGSAQGTMARFTDAKWAGKTPPPGEFGNVAAGVIRCGNLWGNFTLLSNDRDGAKVREGLAVLESLRKVK